MESQARRDPCKTGRLGSQYVGTESSRQREGRRGPSGWKQPSGHIHSAAEFWRDAGWGADEVNARAVILDAGPVRERSPQKTLERDRIGRLRG